MFAFLVDRWPVAVDEIDSDQLPPDDRGAEGDGREPGPWVTVATYSQSSAAHIARLKLESEDIPCLMVDENMVAMNWLWANAVGGIKLQVQAQDAPRAGRVLTTPAASAMARSNPEPLYDGQQRCPRCGSEDIFRAGYSRRFAFLSILLLGAPLPFRRRGMACAACGLEWANPR